jgi:hypothetical protein
MAAEETAGGGGFSRTLGSAGKGGGGGGGGGGSVDSVTGVVPGLVDNTDPANPVVQQQFGPDVTLLLPNSSSALVNALQLILSLTNNAPGSEASQWLAKVLLGGGQADAFQADGNQFLVPGGNGGPALSFFGGLGEGLSRAANVLNFWVAAGVRAQLQNDGALFLNAVPGVGYGWFGSLGGMVLGLGNNPRLDGGNGSGAATGYVYTDSRWQTGKGADVASAGLLSVGFDGNYFAITGTTTISSLSAAFWRPGARLCLELPAGITVKNNSTAGGGSAILLRAGADLITTGVYLLELFFNGTSWLQPG